jgi:hypothetical protein
MAAGGDSLTDSRSCTLWVHGSDYSDHVVFNPVHLPSAKEGDVIELRRQTDSGTAASLLFHVPTKAREHKAKLQISVSQAIAQVFDLANREAVYLSKVRYPRPLGIAAN